MSGVNTANKGPSVWRRNGDADAAFELPFDRVMHCDQEYGGKRPALTEGKRKTQLAGQTPHFFKPKDEDGMKIAL